MYTCYYGISWTVAKGCLDADDSEGKLTAAENHATTMVGLLMIEECYYMVGMCLVYGWYMLLYGWYMFGVWLVYVTIWLRY